MVGRSPPQSHPTPSVLGDWVVLRGVEWTEGQGWGPSLDGCTGRQGLARHVQPPSSRFWAGLGARAVALP